jgi:cytochrome c oxidase assembly factor CtaG
MQPMAKLVYLAAAFFLAAPVALLIALASGTIYPYYNTTPHLFGLSARDDQQLGGILMAVEQSMILFLVFSLAFHELLAADERRPDPLNHLDSA